MPGTMNAVVSKDNTAILNACAALHCYSSLARHGRKHIPCCGSDDLDRASENRLPRLHLEYGMLLSLFIRARVHQCIDEHMSGGNEPLPMKRISWLI